LLAHLAFRQESFVVLLSITPLLGGVLRLDIIAPFHTSGPPLLQFHLAIEQWGNGSSSSFSKKDYATPKDIGTVTISTPISMSTLYQGFICASSTSGPSLFVGFVTAYSGNSLTVRLITSLDSGSGGSLVPNYILLGH